MTRRVSVVLFNLGGPDSLGAVKPFLFNLFNDQAIISLPAPLRWVLAKIISTARHKTAQEIYRHIGGRSPLLPETEAQRDALLKSLKATHPDLEVQVVIAMRYWRPFTQAAAGAVQAFQPDHVVLLPLYPQYSTTTTGSSIEEWTRTYRGSGMSHVVCCYPDHVGLVDAHVSALADRLDGADGSQLRVLFSAHGLPEKIIDGGDPYKDQIERSAAAIAERLNLTDWRVCYQSRVGPMKWIGPSTIEAIKEAGRDGAGIVVVPIAFVSEHSETLVELDRDYRDLAISEGVPEYRRAPAIGVEPSFISALSSMVGVALKTDGLRPGAQTCRHAFSKCPFQAASHG